MLLVASLLFIGMQTFAQTNVTGTVTDANGEPVPGANVRVKGYSDLGTITDLNGSYSLSVPAEATTLIFSFVGMKAQEVAIDGQTTISVTLANEDVGIGEVVVTGVAGRTPVTKLTVTVGKVNEEALKEVPAASAAGALQGKLAGVTVVSAAGNPGAAPTIRLRGATSIYGSQAPLIIVDGVLLEGTLADINVDDIESIEVVKGASASAMYGSRAGNGVVVVTTKRGKGLGINKTRVVFRSEYGESQLANKMKVSQSHQYRLADDWQSESRYTKYAGVTTYGDNPNTDTNQDSIGIVTGGALQIDDDHYMDNPYGVNHDHLEEFYAGGNFYTNYLAVMHQAEKTNLMASFENSQQSGIVMHVNGYNRTSFRLNVDHRISEKLKFSASNLYVKSETDNGSMDFFSLMQLQPDMNLNAKNPDGTDYRVKVDQFGTTVNPLYALSNTDNSTERDRLLGAYTLSYEPLDWMEITAKYTFENTNSKGSWYRFKNYLTLTTLTTGGNGGELSSNNTKKLSQNVQATININKQFGDLTTKFKLSYLNEDLHYEYFRTTGYEFIVKDVPTFTNTNTDRLSSSSNQHDVRARNYFAIADVDYLGKYLGSVLFRYDGASQFGENQRWKPYYRVSAAYRISEDVTIPGIQELKIRGAYGTSGNRPPWYAQYETWSVSAGGVSKNTLGNKDLVPSKITEIEAGLNMNFLNKFNFEFVYSHSDAEDQYYPVPLSTTKGGFKYQWQNMGTLSSEVFEASLGANLIEKTDLSWNMNITWDRIRQSITKLNVAPFTYGAKGNSGDPGSFYIEEGATFGMIYGVRFVETLDEMAAQLPEGATIDDYTVNADGYVIAKGTEGTVNESVIVVKDEAGNDKKMKIGDANPDFRMSISNTVSYKGFTLYALAEWKQGGDIYNLTNQWMMRDYRSADMDMAGKEPNQKKTADYYQSLYSVAKMNKYFVEDGTYLKIREISLYYSIDENKLSGFASGFFKGLRVGVNGRNLWTFTNYKGFDPEVGSTEGGGDNTIQAWDEFAYPNFRTFSGSIQLTF